ncbi:CDP-alcohol phosphatidyltransferase family protein [Patescibacteria group bacterium]|nr:CDP-alcohol phosphatidyltransferase family protein [Patescibacteria group bacterium]
MTRIKYFIEKHPDLFNYLPADEVHPHDHWLARTFLRFFPKVITPNWVTAFRVLATPIVFLTILYGHYKIGVLGFVLVAFTDAIDGSLARTRNQITKFGMMFDPLADKLLIGSMVLILVFKYFNFWLGFVILGLEIIFIITAFIASHKFKKVKMANGWGKIKMILQVFAVCLTLIALVWEIPYLLTVAAWVFGLAIGFAVVSLFSQGI